MADTGLIRSGRAERRPRAYFPQPTPSEREWSADRTGRSDIILSTRVRLHRNLEGFPFPDRMSAADKAQLAGAVFAVCETEPSLRLHAVDLAQLQPYEAVALAERKLITAEFAAAQGSRLLLLNEDESLSVMLCEHDHIRIQTMRRGLCTEQTYADAQVPDSLFDSHFRYAFDERLGFLTRNPADLGTALYAGTVLHLPALSAQGGIFRLASTMEKLGLRIRAVYGEGGTARGDLYRLDNCLTLGLSEQNALHNLSAVTMQLATKERTEAERYVSDIAVHDRIHRAWGLLTTARLLRTDELLDALSLVRLGAVCGLVEVPVQTVDSLYVLMQPANIHVLAGQVLPKEARDEFRAAYVRMTLRETQ